MSTKNIALVHRWFDEVWSQGREGAIEELLAEDAVMHGLGEPEIAVSGPAAFKPFFTKLRATFPDLEIRVEQTVAEGDWVASRWTARMTHQGDHLGVPATGRLIVVTGMSFGRFRDGQLVEGYNNWDQLSLMQQIGSVPAPTVARLLR
jgi:steroid delta-isomerase-like uncharacterized protein